MSLQVPKVQPVALLTSPEDSQHYEEARECVEELALYLKPLSNTRGTLHIHDWTLLCPLTQTVPCFLKNWILFVVVVAGGGVRVCARGKEARPRILNHYY